MNRPPPLPVVVATLLIAAAAHAQPAPADPPEKARARVLLREGVRLLDAGKLAPALRKFEDAYAAFPSAKILVNIGTAQSGLGRPADAANTYQRYLDSGHDDAAQTPAVNAALIELDARLGRLAVTVRAPAGAAVELRVATGPWIPMPSSGLVRVAPGRFELQVRTSAGSRQTDASGAIASGEHKDLALDLMPPDPPRRAQLPRPEPSRSATPVPGEASARLDQPIRPESSRPTALAQPESPRPTALAQPSAVLSPPSAARVPADPVPTYPGRWTPLRYGAVVAGTVGVVSVTAMSVLALRARSLWNDAQPTMNRDLARRAETRANLATAAGIVGAAALGTGAALWFAGAPRRQESSTVTAIVDDTRIGLAIAGQF